MRGNRLTLKSNDSIQIKPDSASHLTTTQLYIWVKLFRIVSIVFNPPDILCHIICDVVTSTFHTNFRLSENNRLSEKIGISCSITGEPGTRFGVVSGGVDILLFPDPLLTVLSSTWNGGLVANLGFIPNLNRSVRLLDLFLNDSLDVTVLGEDTCCRNQTAESISTFQPTKVLVKDNIYYIKS